MGNFAPVSEEGLSVVECEMVVAKGVIILGPQEKVPLQPRSSKPGCSCSIKQVKEIDLCLKKL